MRAVTQRWYGSPDVLSLEQVPDPTPGRGDVLVEVLASAVTQGDRRLRSGDFPGITWLPGRLALGLRGPRARIPGSMFAGRVLAVGTDVSRFAVGDDVFGECGHGCHAEQLVVDATGAIARMPPGIDHVQAAATPYGAVTALTFLRALAPVAAGDRVAVIGAAGGVGCFVVQLAKHFGAEVTAVCRGRDADRVRSLGADNVIDRTRDDFREGGARYDLVFDTSGTLDFGSVRASLTPTGRFATLHMTLGVLWQMLWTRWGGGPKAVTGVALATATDLETIAELLASGALRPVVGQVLSLERIAEAHAAVEAGGSSGCVVVAASAKAA